MVRRAEGMRPTMFAAMSSLTNALVTEDTAAWLVAGMITITKKGGKLHVFPISREMRAILSAQPGNRVGPVFWYVCRRASIKRRVGSHYPVTYEGMKTAWRRTAKRLNIALRFHDMRHTAATRLLRRSGNLKFAQQLVACANVRGP
jgi:integrase